MSIPSGEIRSEPPEHMPCLACFRHVYPTENSHRIPSTMLDQPLVHIMDSALGPSQLAAVEEIFDLRGHSEHVCLDLRRTSWTPSMMPLLCKFDAVKELHLCTSSAGLDQSDILLYTIVQLHLLERFRWLWELTEKPSRNSSGDPHEASFRNHSTE